MVRTQSRAIDLGLYNHRTELNDAEFLSVKPYPALTIKDRTCRITSDQQSDDQSDGYQRYQGQRSHDYIAYSLEIGCSMRQTGSRDVDKRFADDVAQPRTRSDDVIEVKRQQYRDAERYQAVDRVNRAVTVVTSSKYDKRFDIPAVNSLHKVL
jgi:hypothetical protein